MTVIDSKNNEAFQTSRQRNKKINKSKEFNFYKKVNSVFERRRFFDNLCRFKNQN